MGLREERRPAGQDNGVYRDQLITISDLLQFEQNLLAKISGMLKELNGAAMNKWLKSYEVKQLLNISPGTLQHLRDSGILPFTRIGGAMYYKLADIEQMLSTGKTVNASSASEPSERLGKGGSR